MSINISYTAKQTFEFCQEKYRLHYQERLRTKYIESPLIFGSAIDETLNDLLMAYKAKKDFDVNQTFLKYWTNDTYTSELTNYNKSDIEIKLLTKEDISDIINTNDEFWGEVLENFTLEEYVDQCTARKGLSGEDKQALNTVAWHSLKRKGYLLLQAFVDEVLSEIHTVKDVQVKVELENASGDKVYGYIDAIYSFKDEPEKFYIVDHKTTSASYKADSFADSDQLATYSFYFNIPNVAYVVLNKKLRKKHPVVKVQILKGIVPEERVQQTLDDYEGFVNNISSGEFERNIDTGKSCFTFGKVCPFYAYCKEGSMEHLKGDNNGSK